MTVRAGPELPQRRSHLRAMPIAGMILTSLSNRAISLLVRTFGVRPVGRSMCLSERWWMLGKSRKAKPLLGTLMALALLTACANEYGPAFEIVGGGFLFNYRLASVTAGLVVVPRRAFPAGSTVEMSFENPAGGAPIVITKPVTPETEKLDFETPPLSGVKADRNYAVSVRLIDGQGKELERIDKNFRSQLDQSRLPKAPLTIGPGYTPNPQNAPDAGTP